jgi:predicted  nucleic acid-binding Zn-ribbon protein
MNSHDASSADLNLTDLVEKGPPPDEHTTARPNIPFVNLPPESDIPQDAESIEFAQALQALKHLFESRTEYNFMVCDQLALRGVSPNGLNVRKAGSWGAPVAVGADVRAWYTALSSRLSSEHAQIPEAAKRAANSLIEQLWTLATQSVSTPLQQRIEAASQELTAVQNKHKTECEAWAAEQARAQEREVSLALELEEAQSHAAIMRQENERLYEHLQTAQKKIDELTRSIADASLAHEQEKRQMLERQEKLLAEASARMLAVSEQHAKELAIEQERTRTERDASAASARAHALSLDGFRQDLRAATARGDRLMDDLSKAQAAVAELRERASSKDIEMARILKDLDGLSQSNEALVLKIEELHRQTIEKQNQSDKKSS